MGALLAHRNVKDRNKIEHFTGQHSFLRLDDTLVQKVSEVRKLFYYHQVRETTLIYPEASWSIFVSSHFYDMN